MLPRRMALPSRKLVLGQIALGSPAVGPDGSHALYTRRIARAQGYRRHIWIAPLEGGRVRALTVGDVRDSAPRLTPKGDRALFLRDKQVWAVPLEGGEAEQITARPHGVSAFAPAPRGGRLALAAAAPEARFLVGRSRGGAAPVARAIARADWRLDGEGYLDRHTHLYVQESRAGARPRRLTRGDWSVEDFSWSPDAKRIAFCAERGERGDIAAAPAVHAVSVGGGEPALLARLAGSCSGVSWSPDGRHVAFLGIDEEGEPYGCEHSLWVVPAQGGAPRDLAAGRYLHLHPTLASDLVDWEAGAGEGLAWERPEAVISALTLAGRTSLWRFPLEGEPEEIAGCGPHVHGYAYGGGRIVTLRAAAGCAVELHVEREPRGRRRLTRDGTAWQRPLAGIACEDVSVPGRAGSIRATLVSPRGAGRKRLPLVLSIIGGPGSSWGPEPWLPDWALAAAGARVL
ncbi:MAG: hypothetical protein QOH00_1978, partial [Gaiellales bacterium]|nr:hypothetical protein [Gaiellales bacterium]